MLQFIIPFCKYWRQPHFIVKKVFFSHLATNSQHSGKIMSPIKEQWTKIIKSSNDERNYKGLELHNGMRVILISDPKTDQSAACMDVHIGSMSEPSELPGLAHFCEHMLFLGTKKYPSENEYSRFLTEHSGSANAFTSGEHTNYFFDVSPTHLAGVLDRFAQFFLSPLFTESATEREVNAVNSENEKNLLSDMWRVNQLERSLSNPDHPYNRFSTGNRETLFELPTSRGEDVRQKLLQFHNEFYSANLMSLVVYAKEPLEDIEKMVLQHFPDVVNKNVTIPSWPTHPWTEEFLKCKVYITPVKHVRGLRLFFPIPDYTKEYKVNPEGYISHLIGHESKGSLLSELKSHGWVNSLSAGGSSGARGFSSIDVNVDLTEDGIKHIDDIVVLIFQYINMLRDAGPQQWVFDEIRDLCAMRFQFKEQGRPMGYVSGIAKKMREYPMEEVLSARYMISDYRPDIISDMMSYITPDNCRVFIMAQEFQDLCTETEKWYGTKYCNQKIPEDVLKTWKTCGTHPKLHLPKKNAYIAKDFSIKATTNNQVTKNPKLLLNTEQSRLWFKQDDQFKVPKASVIFKMISPVTVMDPLSDVLTCLYIGTLSDAINEDTYDALLAGLEISLASTSMGIQMTLSGFNDKLSVLLEEVLTRLVTFKVEPARFNCIREYYLRTLKNFDMDQPYSHSAYFINFLLSENMWLTQERLAAMSEATIETLERYIPHIFSRIFLETLVYGNVSEEDALKYQKMVETTLCTKLGSRPATRGEIALTREVMLPEGSHNVFQRVTLYQPTSSIELYLQCPEQTTHNRVLVQLICQMLSEPCFNTLRTEEQLGYIVGSTCRRSNYLQGVRIFVQSDRRPDYLEERINAFLLKFKQTLHDMKEDEFQRHVQALYEKFVESPKNMAQQGARYINEIGARHYHFDRHEVESTYLKTVKKEQIIEFYETYLIPEAAKGKRLVVHIVSKKTHGDSLPALESNYKGTIIEDLIGFKYSHPLSPLFQSIIPVEKDAAKL